MYFELIQVIRKRKGVSIQLAAAVVGIFRVICSP